MGPRFRGDDNHVCLQKLCVGSQFIPITEGVSWRLVRAVTTKPMRAGSAILKDFGRRPRATSIGTKLLNRYSTREPAFMAAGLRTAWSTRAGTRWIGT